VGEHSATIRAPPPNLNRDFKYRLVLFETENLDAGIDGRGEPNHRAGAWPRNLAARGSPLPGTATITQDVILPNTYYLKPARSSWIFGSADIFRLQGTTLIRLRIDSFTSRTTTPFSR
jgi:hypothetical protein